MSEERRSERIPRPTQPIIYSQLWLKIEMHDDCAVTRYNVGLLQTLGYETGAARRYSYSRLFAAHLTLAIALAVTIIPGYDILKRQSVRAPLNLRMYRASYYHAPRENFLRPHEGGREAQATP